jgi:alpha-1,2-glucosyltransferase
LRDTNGSFFMAATSVVAFFLLLTLFNNRPIVDEGLHLLAVERLVEGDWSQPDFLPMPLTYHFLVYLPAKVFGVEVWVLRLVNTVLSIALLWIVQSIWGVERSSRGDRLLHFAWLPILFPFTVLAYTEVASLVFLLAGVLLHLRKKTGWAAVPLAIACLVRQSNIVWVAFVIAWGVMDAWQECRRERNGAARAIGQREIATTLSRIWPQLLILVAAAVFFVVNKGFNITAVEANRFRFNSAQFYSFALFLVVLWGPVWVPSLVADFHSMNLWVKRRPGLGGEVILVSLLAAVGAVATFWNPHPWNHNPDFLRNWPLVLMERSILLRGIAALLVLVALPGLTRRLLEAPNRSLLLLALAFSLVYLAPHSLVDPRYYILPMIFLQFSSEFQAYEARRLTIWYATGSVAVSGYIIIAGTRVGGLW